MKTKVIKFVVDNQDVLFDKFVYILEKRNGFLDAIEEENDKIITLEHTLNSIDVLIGQAKIGSQEMRDLFEKRMYVQRELMLLMDPEWLKEQGLEVDEQGNVRKLNLNYQKLPL